MVWDRTSTSVIRFQSFSFVFNAEKYNYEQAYIVAHLSRVLIGELIELADSVAVIRLPHSPVKQLLRNHGAIKIKGY